MGHLGQVRKIEPRILKRLAQKWKSVQWLPSRPAGGSAVTGVLGRSIASVATLVLTPVLVAAQPLAERISVADPQAHPGQGDSWSLVGATRIGAGGRVAYTTQATNLAGGETRGLLNVVLRDLDSGESWRASVGTGGAPLPRSAHNGIVSRDGEAVVFDVFREVVVPPFLYTTSSVYVFDRTTATAREFSLPTSSPLSSEYSVSSDIARVDGQPMVAFSTFDAIDGDDDTWLDVYTTIGDGHFERISARPDGQPGNGSSFSATLSPDGRYVVFVSQATDLLPTPLTAGPTRLFLRDRATQVTTLLTPADAQAYAPVLGDDPRYVAFLSTSASLVAGDTNGAADAFLLDRNTHAISRISVAPGGIQPDLAVQQVALCTGGMMAVFITDAATLPGAIGGGVEQYYVKDLSSGALVAGPAVHVTTWPNSTGAGVALSADCAQVAYSTGSDDPTPGDHNEASDAVSGPLAGTMRQVFSRHDGLPLPAQPNGPSVSARQSVSADGDRIVFASRANNLVVGDDNRRQDIFVRDRATASTSRVNRRAGGAEFAADATCPAISADGNVVAYVADGVDVGLVPGTAYLVVAEIAEPEPEVIAIVPPPASEPEFDDCPSLSANGARVAFSSDVALVPQDANGLRDAYVYDRGTSTFLLASVNAAGTFAGNGASTFGDLSGDGTRVVFETAATDIDVSTTVPAMFVRNLATNTSAFIYSDNEYAGRGADPRIDYAGTAFGFRLDALLQPFACFGANVALHRFTFATGPRCISRSLVDFAGAGLTSSWALASSGRWAASWSGPNGCTASDCRRVYLLDARSGEPLPASLAESGGTIAVGPHYGQLLQPAVSDQGTVVYATNSAMRANDLLGWADVYAVDVVAPDTIAITSFE